MRQNVPRHNIQPHLSDILPQRYIKTPPERRELKLVVDLRSMLEAEEVFVGETPLSLHLFIPQREEKVGMNLKGRGGSEPRPRQLEASQSHQEILPQPQKDFSDLPTREALVDFLLQLEEKERARQQRLGSYRPSAFDGEGSAIALDKRPSFSGYDQYGSIGGEGSVTFTTPAYEEGYGLGISWDTIKELARFGVSRALQFALVGLSIIFISFGLSRGFSWAQREVLDLKRNVLERGKEGFALLEQGKDLLLAGKFAEAQKSFQSAEDKIPLNPRLAALASVVPLPGDWSLFVNGAEMLRSASRLGESAALLASAFLNNDGNESARVQSVVRFENTLGSFLPLFKKIDPGKLPPQLYPFKKTIEDNQELLEQIPLWFGSLKAGAGFEGERSYLLLFQNNSELRASGGFIGTYGLLRLKNGAVSDFWVDDVYNRDGQLKLRVVPPRAMQGITETWALRDSNWFFDFPTSARKAAWFYEQVGDNKKIDGVIAITPEFIEGLLGLTGPVVVPQEASVNGKELSVDKSNLIEVLQREVYVQREQGAEQPKVFVKAFGEQFYKLLENEIKENPLAVLDVAGEALREKSVMVWLRDEQTNAFIARRGWDGAVKDDLASDYLGVVLSNVKGFKSDYVTENEFSYRLLKSESGGLVGEVTIQRKHNGKNAPYAWWRRANRAWVRLFTPPGSILLSAEGDGLVRPLPTLRSSYGSEFIRDADLANVDRPVEILLENGVEVLKEAGKTVFAAWMEVPAGEKRTLKFKYLFPASVSESDYRLLWQKQPGVKASYEVYLPNGEITHGDLSEDVSVESKPR